jgi:outer membrane receptor protein involved in Fe transport
VSSVKPRFSYGVNGNVAGIGNYEVQGVYGSQGNYNTNLGFLSTSIINTGLRWEKSTTLDVGVDLGLLKNRISLMVDYYDRRTSDLLTNLTLPSYTGYSSVRTNLGTFQNTGLELTLNATILQKPNGLVWNVGVMFRSLPTKFYSFHTTAMKIIAKADCKFMTLHKEKLFG